MRGDAVNIVQWEKCIYQKETSTQKKHLNVRFWLRAQTGICCLLLFLCFCRLLVLSTPWSVSCVQLVLVPSVHTLAGAVCSLHFALCAIVFHFAFATLEPSYRHTATACSDQYRIRCMNSYSIFLLAVFCFVASTRQSY